MSRKQLLARAKAAGLPRSAVDMYLAIVRYESYGRAAWPAVATLAAAVGLSERTTRTLLRRLEGVGWIETTMRNQRTSIYRPIPQTAIRSGSSCPRSSSYSSSSTKKKKSGDKKKEEKTSAIKPLAKAQPAPSDDGPVAYARNDGDGSELPSAFKTALVAALSASTAAMALARERVFASEANRDVLLALGDE